MNNRQYVDRQGNLYTHVQLTEILERCLGHGGAADYLRVGELYENGGLWFQRLYDLQRCKGN